MKKKNFNGILIFGVILIWLFVFKKSFSFFDNEDEIVQPLNDTELSYVSALEFKKDTFDIQDYERDPFLDTFKKKKVTFQKKTNNNRKVDKKSFRKNDFPKLKWPKLQYFGYIKGGDETRKLALIKINSKLHRVREKQNIDDIYIRTVYKDSVILKMNNELKTIKK